MEIGEQIKKYRTEMGLSQDRLAEKIFVSRQTISNWENNKNYPDVKSLLLLSCLFNVSWSYVNILDTKSQTFLCCTSS